MSQNSNFQFQSDEMQSRSVQTNWTKEELLAQEGIFFLKDILDLLGIKPEAVKRHVKAIRAKKQDAYAVMGVRKVWNHWVVRMKVFAPYFKQFLIPKTRPVDPMWNGNDMLRQEGWFRLAEVCQKIPLGINQIRYQAKKQGKAARKNIGVWKDAELDVFLVDMPIFADWIKKIWSPE